MQTDMGEQHPRSKSEYGWLVLLLLVVALLYLGFLPVNYDFDGTVFSQILRRSLVHDNLSQGLQVHHILYFPVNFGLYRSLSATVGYNALEYVHLQLFSLLFGLATLVACYRILRRFCPPVPTLLGTGLIAACYGFWTYAVTAEVDMPGLFFITAGWYLLISRRDTPGAAGTGFLFALAAGFHLTNGLVLVSALLLAVLHRGRWKHLLALLSAFSITLFMIYLAAHLGLGFDVIHHLRNNLAGLNIYSGGIVSNWSPLTLESLRMFFTKLAATLLFQSDTATTLLSVGVLLGMVGMVVWNVRKGKRHEDGPTRERAQTLLFPAWMLPFALFFFLFAVSNLGFKLHIFLPLVLWFIISLNRWRSSASVPVTAAMVILLLSVNVISAIIPHSRVENNPPYELAEAVGLRTEPGAVVLISGYGSPFTTYGKIYIPYFGLRQVLVLDWLLSRGHGLDRISEMISARVAAGQKIYLLSELVSGNPETLDKLLARHRIRPAEYSRFLAGLNPGSPIPLVHGYFLREITPPGALPGTESRDSGGPS